MDLDQKAFRTALSHFVTGVTVVTTLCKNGSKQGITANSFNSVSLDPPLILVSLARSLGCFKHFETCTAFAVNLLRADQVDLSNRFASRGADKWSGVSHYAGCSGVPILADRLAVFECVTHAQHDGGDHIIILGKVVHFEAESEHHPLVYFRGRYSQIARHQSAE